MKCMKKPRQIFRSVIPLSNGVIADINNMERLIHLFISDMSKGNIRPADFYIAVPTDITEVEKQRVFMI